MPILVLLLAAGCQGQPSATATPASASTPAASQPAATATSEASLPMEATTLKQLEADLDGDGSPEQVTVYQAGEQVGVLVAPGKGQPWRADLATGVMVTDLRTNDLNGDGRPELLIEASGPEANEFQLWPIVWAAGRGQILAAPAEAAGSGGAFRSQFYPPLLDDLDVDAHAEIILGLDTGNPDFVESATYTWDGQGYVKTDFFVVPPRLKPTPNPS